MWGYFFHPFMEIIEIVLVAVGLSMDSFSVSFAAGIGRKELQKRYYAIFPLFMAVFQAGLFAFGWFLGHNFEELIKDVDHWIAFGLLAFIGVRMIIDGLKPAEEEKSFNPLAFWNMITLSVGTSIDALAVGVAFACSQQAVGVSSAIIWICTYMFSFVGMLLGRFLGRKINFPFEVVGGVILICIGIKILLEHLLA